MIGLSVTCLLLVGGKPCSVASAHGVRYGDAPNGAGVLAASLTAGPSALPTGLQVNVKVWLEGPLVLGVPTLMNDSLRASSAFPLTEPYTALGFSAAGGGGAETTSAAVLAVTGDDAIVDWVRIELRSASAPGTLVDATHALVQRDGDVVSANDGTSTVGMHVVAGDYYVVVRHRNHLGCMTATAVALGTSATTVDFRSSSTATWGTAARKSVGGVMALWAGNTFYDSPLLNMVKYTNLYNDREPILTAIGGVVPTNTASGYLMTDVNLDGRAKYTGSNNDREFILSNIGGVVPTNTRAEQLP